MFFKMYQLIREDVQQDIATAFMLGCSVGASGIMAYLEDKEGMPRDNLQRIMSNFMKESIFSEEMAKILLLTDKEIKAGGTMIDILQRVNEQVDFL